MSRLKKFDFGGFAQGYDSFSGSRSQVKNQEIPAIPGITQNVDLDENGSPKKRSGYQYYSAAMSPGFAVTGGKEFLTPGNVSVIAACGSSWWKCGNGTAVQLPGATFTPNQQTLFDQASGFLVGGNGVDPLSYTDGSTVTQITVNSINGYSPVFYNNRIYCIGPSGDRVYYSNTLKISNLSPGGTVNGVIQEGSPTFTSVVSNLDFTNMFNTDLTQTPKLNAGFLVFNFGSGIKLKRLKVDGDQLWAYSSLQGFSSITPLNVNVDGTITHSVRRSVVGTEFPAANGLQKVQQNDQYFFGGDNIYSRGEVQYYASARVTTQSGRIQSEMRSVSQDGKKDVAIGFYQNKVYVAYRSGGPFNNQIIVQDRVLNAWSTPWIGIPCSFFIDYTDINGSKHLLAGSSDPSRPYMLELNVGLNDAGSPITSAFETKSSDCGLEGQVKYAAFVDVFYQQLSGTLDCEVIADETTVIGTRSQQQQIVATGSAGVGSQLVGTFLVGQEFTPGSVTGAISYEGQFRIATNYKPYRRISVRFSNNRLNEQYKVNDAVVWFKEGSINTPLK